MLSKEQMNQGHSQNIYYVSVDVNLLVENVTRDKNGAMISVSVNVKTQENLAHVKRTCRCDCDKDYEIREYLKNCECVKSLADDLVVTYDETEDRPKSAVME